MNRNRKLLVVALLGAIPAIGSGLDSSWHFHDMVENFINPPHMVVFIGIMINLIYHFLDFRAIGFKWKNTQIYTKIGVAASTMCFIFFGLDFFFHEFVWGFESGVDGIYSLSHWGLVVGITGIAASAFIYYTKTNEGRMPAIISFVFATNMVGFLLLPALPFHALYSSSMGGQLPVDFADKFNILDYAARTLGIVGMVIYTIQMTIFVLIGRYFNMLKSFSALLIFFVLNTLNIVVSRDHYAFLLLAVGMAIAGRLLFNYGKFGFGVFFFLVFVAYFIIVQAFYGGVWWELSLLTGLPLWLGTFSFILVWVFDLIRVKKE